MKTLPQDGGDSKRNGSGPRQVIDGKEIPRPPNPAPLPLIYSPVQVVGATTVRQFPEPGRQNRTCFLSAVAVRHATTCAVGYHRLSTEQRGEWRGAAETQSKYSATSCFRRDSR